MNEEKGVAEAPQLRVAVPLLLEWLDSEGNPVPLTQETFFLALGSSVWGTSAELKQIACLSRYRQHLRRGGVSLALVEDLELFGGDQIPTALVEALHEAVRGAGLAFIDRWLCEREEFYRQALTLPPEEPLPPTEEPVPQGDSSSRVRQERGLYWRLQRAAVALAEDGQKKHRDILSRLLDLLSEVEAWGYTSRQQIPGDW